MNLRKRVFNASVSQAGVPGNEWTSMLLEATTEVLKMASSPVALLLQALLQYVTKMAARSVFVQFPWFHFQLECIFSFNFVGIRVVVFFAVYVYKWLNS